MQLSLMFAVLSSDRESSQRKLGEDSPGRDQLGAKACVSHRFSMSRSLRSRFGTGYNSSEGPIASAWARAALGFHLLPSLLVLLARSCSTCVARELLWILDGPNDWFPGLAPSPAPPAKTRGAESSPMERLLYFGTGRLNRRLCTTMDNVEDLPFGHDGQTH